MLENDDVGDAACLKGGTCTCLLDFESTAEQESTEEVGVYFLCDEKKFLGFPMLNFSSKNSLSASSLASASWFF